MFLQWKRKSTLWALVDVQGEGAEAGGAAGGGVVNTPAQPGGNQVPEYNITQWALPSLWLH